MQPKYQKFLEREETANKLQVLVIETVHFSASDT